LEDLSRQALSVPKSVRLLIALAQRESLANTALENGDLRMALSAWESRDKLLGLTEGVSISSVEANSLLVLIKQAAYNG
jgi:hypothetical protein